MAGLNLHDLANACRAALATAPEAGGYDVLVHANDDVYALEGASLDGTCNGTDVFRLMALDHDAEPAPVHLQLLQAAGLADAPTVVCASCGRTIDRPPAKDCEAEGWHQPQLAVRDADVGAEDGDDLVPMDDDAWQAAVGPRPGQTWADLYGRTHVALSYKGAQLEGVTRELVRTRQLLHVAQEELRTRASEADALTTDTMRLLAAIVRQHGSVRPGGNTELRLPERAMLQPAGQVSWYDDPATGDRVWRVQP